MIGCGGSASTPPASLIIDPAAVPVLDAWAAAIGGRDKIAALDGIHETGTVSREGYPEGTYEIWRMARGERFYRESLAGFDTVRVFDGTHVWERDGAGNVRDGNGDELAFERTFTFWTSFAALVPGRSAGEVRAATNNTLVIAPRDGHEVTVSFDATTHRPVAYSQLDGETAVIDTLDDWRVVDGVWFPFRTSRTWNGGNLAVWKATALDHAPPPPFARPIPRPTPRLLAPVMVPLEIAGGVGYVSLRVGDSEPLRFLLDTALPYSVVRSDIAGGKPSYPHATLHIGQLDVIDIPLDTHRFDEAAVRQFAPLDGILGYDVLAKYAVEIDATTKTLRFGDRDSYRHGPGGNAIAMVLEHAIPVFPITLELPNRKPIEARVGLDTTCPCAVKIGTAFTESNHLLDRLDGAPVRDSRGLIGLSARADGVRIGTARLLRPFVLFSTEHDFRDPEIVGTVGFGALPGYIVVLDYAHDRIWFDPSVSAAASD